jgi:hypothetical protein
MAGTPRDVVGSQTSERAARAGRESFSGYGVMGLPFSSGHVLGLRSWATSSIGPPYLSVWHRDPAGRWDFWSTAAPDLSCTRYTGELSDETSQSKITVEWPHPFRLVVRSDAPELEWVVTLGTSIVTRALGAVARLLPDAVVAHDGVLRMMGPVAGRLLGAGPLAMTGRMPNGQSFHLLPSYVWPVVESSARLHGEDLGVPAPLPEQATIGDFRIPQRGILAAGTIDFEPFDAARHSAAIVRTR